MMNLIISLETTVITETQQENTLIKLTQVEEGIREKESIKCKKTRLRCWKTKYLNVRKL
jgi:tetrahydromethanopterin S-methyltransferase subunit B